MSAVRPDFLVVPATPLSQAVSTVPTYPVIREVSMPGIGKGAPDRRLRQIEIACNEYVWQEQVKARHDGSETWRDVPTPTTAEFNRLVARVFP